MKPTSYTYSLDRSSRKHICPQCGRRTLVVYLDGEGRMLDRTVGRCDRANNCCYHYPPRQYFSDNGMNVKPRIQPPAVRLPLPPAEPLLTINPEVMASSLARPREDNDLAVWIHSVMDPIAGRKRVNQVLDLYRLGTDIHGRAVFWQIDPEGRIHTGKIMAYDRASGRRVKTPRPALATLGSSPGRVVKPFEWAHSFKRATAGTRMVQTFYGAHLLGEMPSEARLMLFECEKTALIVAIMLSIDGRLGERIPIATGGCQGLNPTVEHLSDPHDRHHLLSGREVELYPDNGKLTDWRLKAASLRKIASEVYISTLAPGDPDDDLADVIIDSLVSPTRA